MDKKTPQERRDYMRQWRARNPNYEPQRKADIRYKAANRDRLLAQGRSRYPSVRERQIEQNRLRRTGMSPEEYNRKRFAQRGLCAICEERPATHADHNHGTGQTRGVLCSQCNTAIGLLNESPELLRMARKYLLRWTAQEMPIQLRIVNGQST